MKPWQIAAFAASLFAMGPARIEAAEFRAGAAAVRITPDKPTPLAGYYNTRIPTNTHDELRAKTIVLEQDGVRAALVVCDLLTLSRDVVERTREIVSRTTGVPGANVMLSATHTHTGPLLANKSSRNITDSSSVEVIREYTDSLPARIAESVRLAEAALQPARMAV